MKTTTGPSPTSPTCQKSLRELLAHNSSPTSISITSMNPIQSDFRSTHITPVLRNLHWLPVKHRKNFKILLTTFKALNNLAPSYLSDLLPLHAPTRCLWSLSLTAWLHVKRAPCSYTVQYETDSS